MLNPLKIAVVTQYYAPDLPSWLPTGLARELAARGHSVRVLTAFPHYESGRISHGYRQRLRFLEKDGDILVRRVPVVPSHSANPVTRIANYLSFIWSTSVAHRFVRDADVVYVYATPMTVAESPRRWARKFGLPYVLHVQDLWPESVTGSGMLPARVNKLVERRLTRWLEGVYSEASAAIASAPTMRQSLVDRGMNEDSSHAVLNWSNDADDATPSRNSRASLTHGGMVVVYAGNLGKMQDLLTVVEAAARARDLPNFRLLIAGSGVMETELRRLISQLDAAHVELVGRIDGADMSEFYDSADFQVVPLRRLPIFEGTIPSKVQAGLANGLPLITTVAGEVSTIVERERLGFTAAAEDSRSLEQALRAAYASSQKERDAMSVRAREFYDKTMSRENAVNQIESVLRGVAAARQHAAHEALPARGVRTSPRKRTANTSPRRTKREN